MATAVAAGVDPRGWTEGKVASNTARVTQPIADPPLVLDLPKAFAKKVRRRTLIVYFSPSCPHCKHVAPELGRLAARHGKDLDVLGVATSRATEAEVVAFKGAYRWDFEVVRDTDRSLGASLGARSTPSVALVDRVGGEVQVVDAWYPYVEGSDVVVEMRLGKTPFEAFTPGRYVGNRTCGACHTQELEAWSLSHHSVAWRTLVRSDKDEDAACVGCHVTGHQQPMGWDGTPATSKLEDVGCEACHGPGGPHDGTSTAPATTCEGCHDAKHSIAFSYGKGLPLIDHFRTVGMDDDTYRQARRALLDGEAPRELLAFGDGAYAGAEACASCHAETHAGWKDDPHGQAMASLKKAGTHEQVACVRCHATPMTGGPPSDALSGYRVDEGVGCESCHGPGQAHVDAKGGTDNIVGLGASCPVCVIEAVCTSCHTSQWDPSWSLEEALEKVRHPGAAAPSE